MESFYHIIALIFGLLVGSFLNVIIYRVPLGKDFVYDRSACPVCNAQLRWWHNLPLISFLFLKGKCAFCGTKISIRYPLIELATGLIAYNLFPHYVTTENLGLFLFYFTVACIFLCHFFIDLDHHLLLDSLNLYLLAVFLPYVLLTFPWQYWSIGAALGLGVPLSVTWLFYKIRGIVGLGGGDIKLYAVLGFMLGPMGIMFNIFMSCFVGAFVGLILIGLKKTTKEKPLAFGPSILAVASLQIFFPSIAVRIQSLLF